MKSRAIIREDGIAPTEEGEVATSKLMQRQPFESGENEIPSDCECQDKAKVERTAKSMASSVELESRERRCRHWFRTRSQTGYSGGQQLMWSLSSQKRVPLVSNMQLSDKMTSGTCSKWHPQLRSKRIRPCHQSSKCFQLDRRSGCRMAENGHRFD